MTVGLAFCIEEHLHGDNNLSRRRLWPGSHRLVGSASRSEDTGKSIWDMSPEEFEAYKNKIREKGAQ